MTFAVRTSPGTKIAYSSIDVDKSPLVVELKSGADNSTLPDNVTHEGQGGDFDEGCPDIIRIRGASKLQDHLNGDYYPTHDEECKSRPFYQQANNEIYMYFAHFEGLRRGWVVSPRLLVHWCPHRFHTVGMAGEGDVPTPDLIKEWREVVNGTFKINPTIDDFRVNPNAEAVCISKIPTSSPGTDECKEVILQGANSQKRLNGVYHKLSMDNNCQGRPTYRSSFRVDYQDHYYIYYTPHLDGHPPSWMVGATLCPAYIHHQAIIAEGLNATTPDRVTGVWKEYDSIGDKWVFNENISMTCENGEDLDDTVGAASGLSVSVLQVVISSFFLRVIYSGAEL